LEFGSLGVTGPSKCGVRSADLGNGDHGLLTTGLRTGDEEPTKWGDKVPLRFQLFSVLAFSFSPPLRFPRFEVRRWTFDVRLVLSVLFSPVRSP
jgi:hypothetical protein